MASQYDLSTQEKIGIAFSKIGGICRLKTVDQTTREMYYIRGILRNRMSYVNDGMVMSLLGEAVDAGADIQKLKQLATEVRSWTKWRETLEDFIESKVPIAINSRQHKNYTKAKLDCLREVCESLISF